MVDIAAQLVSAKVICEQRGGRFTPLRRQVFMLLAQLGRAMGAYDILTQLQQTQPSAKPPTVYRALDFLMAQGLVHKISSTNMYKLCCDLHDEHSAQWLICDECGDVEECHEPNWLQGGIAHAMARGFKVRLPILELHGCCARCGAR